MHVVGFGHYDSVGVLHLLNLVCIISDYCCQYFVLVVSSNKKISFAALEGNFYTPNLDAPMVLRLDRSNTQEPVLGGVCP